MSGTLYFRPVYVRICYAGGHNKLRPKLTVFISYIRDTYLKYRPLHITVSFGTCRLIRMLLLELSA